MQDIYFRCQDGMVECHPKFFTCPRWYEAATTIVKFVTVLDTSAPFLHTTGVSVTLDVTNEEVYVSGANSVLISRGFELWPDEGELVKMLYSMLSEIVS